MDTKLTVGNLSPFHCEGRVSHCREGKVDLYRYALYQKNSYVGHDVDHKDVVNLCLIVSFCLLAQPEHEVKALLARLERPDPGA